MRVQIWKRLKQNYDIIVGLVVFATYRFLFTYLLWKDRGVPPEPDDSYFYLATAKIFPSVVSFEDFRLLPFSTWLNFVSLFTNSNLERAYEVNFYIGSVVMFFALYYFLKNIETSKIKRLFLITIMSLYSGSGAYHGFYWVVPSFYQLGLFFILLTFILSDRKQSHTKIFLLSLLFIFVHPSSIFISTVFLFFALIISIINRRFFTKIKNNLTAFFLSLTFSYALYYLIGKPFSHSGSPESFERISEIISNLLRWNVSFQALETIHREYFSIFFFDSLSTLVFFLMFVFVFFIKKIKLLILYLCILVLVAISSILPYGWRTLSFLWPLTFLLIGYSLLGLYRFIEVNFKQFRILAVIPALFLFSFTSTFNLIGIKSVNAKNDYGWERSCPQKLEQKNVFFYSNESMNAFILHGLNHKNAHFLSMQNLNDYLDETSAIIEINHLVQKNENLSDYEKLLSRITRQNTKFQPPQSAPTWIKQPISKSELEYFLMQKELIIKPSYDCGHFQIYSISRE